MQQSQEDEKPTPAKDKITDVLTECRVVLPGAQALLGFQFISMLSQEFGKLPQSSKLVHVGSLAAMALAVICLMTPAAYHRLVEDGEATEHFHRFASRMLLLSMVPLAAGICGDFFVVLRIITEAAPLALAVAAVLFAGFLGAWFGLTWLLRQRKEHAHPRLVTAS